MMLTGTGKFVKDSPAVEVCLNKQDDYLQVATKAAHVIGTNLPEGKRFVLISAASGVLLPPQLRDEAVWTLGGFLRQRRKKASKIELGLAVVNETMKCDLV